MLQGQSGSLILFTHAHFDGVLKCWIHISIVGHLYLSPGFKKVVSYIGGHYGSGGKPKYMCMIIFCYRRDTISTAVGALVAFTFRISALALQRLRFLVDNTSVIQ
jgi:hypothetical protein